VRGGAGAVSRSARNGANALADEAGSGYEEGRRAAQQSWHNHPLLMAAAALAAGAAVGWILPSTRQENRLVGKTSDKLTGRIKETTAQLWDQGRTVAGRVINEAVDATAREIEREGLSPDRLGKKVKRVASHVRDAVAEAVQE